jgi:iron complex transport system ATP-binding protein
MSLIAAEDLAVGHEGRVVVRGIDLAVEPGEVVCLLGPNGAGKTTLFRTLLGLQPPLAGRALLDGRSVPGLARREVARTVAYVPQSMVAPFAFTVLDLPLMGRTVHLGPFSPPGRDDVARTMAALAALGVAELAHADATRISGGQRQLTLIARALAQDARAIVMDEPTASLDFGNRLRLLDRIRALADGGLGLIVSTHEPDQAWTLADRVALIAGGRLAAFGPPRAVMTPERLSEVYGVPVAVEHTAAGRAVFVGAAR